MANKNPHAGHCAGADVSITADANSPNKKADEQQGQSDDPAIYISKDGPIFRVQILPPQSLETSTGRPETYAGPIAARQAAAWLSKATGLRIVDLVEAQP